MSRALVGLGLVAISWVLAACHGGPHDLPVLVNSFVDGGDAAPGDGVCEMTPSGGDCSIRAAVDEANAYVDPPLRVSIPAGHYDLTLAGSDDSNATGDLDVAPAAGSLILDADPSSVVVDGSGLDGVIDLHSGVLLSEGVGLTGAAGPGVRVRSGATGGLTYASVYDNSSAGMQIDGGGIGELAHVTVTGNGAGGVANEGEFSSLNLTITGNTGGGIIGSGVVTTLDSTVVADQASGPDCGIAIPSDGFNLDSDGSCGLDHPTDMSGVEASLDVSSGGDNPYHQPLVGSDIIDAVPDGTGWCLNDERPLDQRGTGRPIEVGCDRGAVEAENLPAILVNDEGDTNDLVPGDGDCEDAAGNCTLRAAIEETNASPGHEVVAFSPSLGDIVLPPTATVLALTDDLTVRARGGSLDGSATTDANGVIHVQAGTLRVERLTLVGGAAGVTVDSDAYFVESTITEAVGRAVRVSDNANFRMLRSTLSRNDGGGIFNRGFVLVRNSTIAENTAPSHGIAIYNYNAMASADIFSSTIADNWGRRSAVTHGTQPHSGQTRVFNSIIHHRGELDPACGEPVFSLGQNLDDDESCHFHHPNDLSPGPAYLLPLADNGGFTETMVPLEGSVLVGAGQWCPTWDQRLRRRPPWQATCDIGAVEGAVAGPIPLDLVVDSASDSRDINAGDGICLDASGYCTLRAAIDETNARPTVDRIVISPGIDPMLTRVGSDEDDNDTGDLDIDDWVEIEANGATVTGLPTDRVLHVHNGGLELDQATVTGGLGGIRAMGATVRLTDSLLTGLGGPGVAVDGALVVIGTTIDGNLGSGIVTNDGSLYVEDSVISNNSSSTGGGIFAAYSDGTVLNSTIQGNSASGKGGGIWWNGYYNSWPNYEVGWLLISGTSILDNSAGQEAGALLSESGEVLIEHSTISGNNGQYGAVYAVADRGTTIRGSTIVDNTSDAAISGFVHRSKPFFIEGSVIVHAGPACNRVTSLGYNAASDSTCDPGPTDLTGVTGVLGLLGSHGGLTSTYLPVLGGQLVDAIPTGTVRLCDGSIPLDQRGEARPSGSGCDIGSVERQPSDP